MQTFTEVGLPRSIELSIQELGYVTPTPIQSKAIPLVLEGSDIIGLAQTGTGKTAAFSIPILSKLIADPTAKALILVPTRELAAQVSGVLKGLLTNTPQMKTATLIGGTSMRPQIRELSRKPNIIIATPGRLIDHLGQRTVSLEHVKFLVLDEADRMLDMGFAPQIMRLAKSLNKERQTLLFSATFPKEIEALAHQILRNPIRVQIGTVSKPVEKIEQKVLKVTAATKNNLLLDELNARNEGAILIFARTKHRTDRLFAFLEDYGYAVARIHGGRSQGQRTAAINAFRSGEIRILVATDIASRGLDIPEIGTVINYDLPDAAEDYVHRIGRTGRAGAMGESLSLLLPEDQNHWNHIQRLVTGQKSTGYAPHESRTNYSRSRPSRGSGFGGRRTERSEFRDRKPSYKKTESRDQSYSASKPSAPRRENDAYQERRRPDSDAPRKWGNPFGSRRSPSDDRPSRDERSARSDRPMRSERPARGDRPTRGGEASSEFRSSERSFGSRRPSRGYESSSDSRPPRKFESQGEEKSNRSFQSKGKKWGAPRKRFGSSRRSPEQVHN